MYLVYREILKEESKKHRREIYVLSHRRENIKRDKLEKIVREN